MFLGGAENGDKHMCVCLCLSVHSHNLTTIVSKLIILAHVSSAWWPWLGPPLAARRYDLYFRF